MLLGEESENAGSGLASSRQVVVLQFGEFPAIRDRMKVEIEDLGLREEQGSKFSDPGVEQRLLMLAESTVGIVGGEGFFGEDVEASEKAKGLLEIEIVDVTASFFVEEFETQEAEQGIDVGDHFRGGIVGLLDETLEVELREQR